MLFIGQIIISLSAKTIRAFSANPAQDIERRLPVICDVLREVDRPPRRHPERMLRIIDEKIIILPVLLLSAEQTVSPPKPGLRIGLIEITNPRLIGNHVSGISHSLKDTHAGPLIHIARAGSSLDRVRSANAVQGHSAAHGKREYMIFIFQKDHPGRGGLSGYLPSDPFLLCFFRVSRTGKPAMHHFSFHIPYPPASEIAPTTSCSALCCKNTAIRI